LHTKTIQKTPNFVHMTLFRNSVLFWIGGVGWQINILQSCHANSKEGEIMYLSVGQPIGTHIAEGAIPLLIYQIDINGESAFKDGLHACFWMNLFISNLDENLAIKELHKEVSKETAKHDFDYDIDESIVLECVNRLIENGIVIQAKSNNELYDRIKHLTALRNGLPVFDKEAFIESRKLIHVIDDLSLSDLQMDIWRNADGKRTIEEIYNESFSMIEISTFIDNLLFIRVNLTIF